MPKPILRVYTQAEMDETDRQYRHLLADEGSGKVPFVGIESTLPPLIPLPSDPGDVVATFIKKK